MIPGLLFVGFWGVAGVLTAAAAVRMCGLDAATCARTAVPTLGLGGIVASWLLIRLLDATPARDVSTYAWMVGLWLAALTGYGRSAIGLVLAECRRFGSDLVQGSALSRTLIVATLFVLAITWSLGLALPVASNDSLEYLALARVFWAERDVGMYPMLVGYGESGLLAPYTHPLGYPGLILIAYAFQGSALTPFLAKAIAPLLLTLTTAAIWVVMRRSGDPVLERRELAGAAVLVFVSTPGVFVQASNAHIDPLRIYTFLLAVVWGLELLRRPGAGPAIVAGVAAGLSMDSHSSNVLTLPFVWGVLAWGWGMRPTADRCARLFGLSALAIALVLGRYMVNLEVFGRVIGDTNPIFELPVLEWESWIRSTRNLEALWKRVVFGAFQGLTLVQFFGASYWLACASLAALAVRRARAGRLPEILIASILIVVGFQLLMLLTVAAGMDLVIKNFRYLLMIQPFVAIVAASGLSAFERWAARAGRTQNGSRQTE